MAEPPTTPNTGKPETGGRKDAGPTTYIVLRRETVSDVTQFDAWRIENSNVPATSAEAAIRLACKTDDKPYGTYVAVPARSWKPVTVKAETTVTLKIEEAG